MANHKKPTSDELEEGIRKTQEELEKLEAVTSQEKENEKKQAEKLIEKVEAEEESVNEDEAQEDSSESEKDEKGDEDETQDEKNIDEVGKDEKEDIDYKKKFVNSTRESQVLHSKNKKINEVVEKAITMSDPTDEELIAEFPDWDIMSDTERKLAKKTYKYDKAFAMLNEVTRESKDAETWNSKVDTFIEDPKTLNTHPDLEGKEDDFKMFASKPTRRGVDFEDLIKAFLFDVSTTRKPNKGRMFETGAGGQDKKERKSNILTANEGRALMKANYKKWKELLMAGKIANE